MGDETKLKSFWDRPEGKTGMLFLILILGGIGFGLWAILPIIIVLLQSTLYAALLFAAVATVGFLALDSKIHALVGYMYKASMRKITGAFIQLDPIAIVEIYIADMEKNRSNMNKQISNLKGKIRDLQLVIKKNDSDRQNNLQLAQAAKDKGVTELMTLKVRKAGRLEKSNFTLQELFTRMELLYRVLAKMYDTSGYVIEDVKDEVDVKKRERGALQAGTSAFKSAMLVIKGDPDKKYMFDQAMDFMVEDIGAKLGEMERFMEISQEFTQTLDLQNGIYDAEGLKKLEEWSNNGTSTLLGNDKTLLIDKAHNSREVLDLDAPPEKTERKESKYNKLFE